MPRWMAVLLGVVAGCLIDCRRHTTESPATALVSTHRYAPDPRLALAVDARVELVSVVFRLAGNPEYLRASTPYAAAVDQRFATCRAHPAVASASALRTEHGIAFDAPMRLAAHLDARTYEPIVPLAPTPALLERFAGADLPGFVAQLSAFAHECGFDAVFASQRVYREAVEARFRAALATRPPVIAWYDALLGARPSARYLLAPGLLSGVMAYSARAVRADGGEDVVQVMHLEQPDVAGVPSPTASTLEYLVHELGHSYLNPIVDAHLDVLAPAASAAFERVRGAMVRQHYPTVQIMLEESVVRAVTALNIQDVTPERVEPYLRGEEGRGFLWIRALVGGLERARRAHGGALGEGEIVEATRAAVAP